jgi:hypothetical protein
VSGREREFVFDLHCDLSVAARGKKQGSPERIDGDVPHGGEIYSDRGEV